MKQIIFAFGLFIFMAGSSKKADAQYYFYSDVYYDNPMLFEGGVSLGAMNCLTDIGGKKGLGKKFIKDLNIGNTHVAGGFYISAIYKNAFAIRVEATFGKVSAHDSILKGVTDIAKTRYNRNLHFRSNITEFAALAEIHPLFIFIDWAGRDEAPPRYSPYLLAGIGYFSYNPQAKLGENWIDLKPLSTEGQGIPKYAREPYKLQQMNIPIGLGVKYELSPLLNVRGEFLYRKLNTDYLDDVSTTYINPDDFKELFPVGSAKYQQARLLSDRQIVKATAPTGGGKRGGPNQKDAYFTFNVKIGIVIGRERIR